tara:strand:+ start:175 stop:420 length:246 start_codon:yes stop_codon:yes gene_type:complete
MATFDDAMEKLGKNFTYSGEAPTNESEYNTHIEGKTDMPTWTEVQTVMSEIVPEETVRTNAKAKLVAGEALTEAEANTVVS